ncbi:MAG: FkbM family methyltransferase [Pedobacter sp.]|nr:MAG: FkbM family methyltransferase [Pedobacter sp.]
MNYKLFIGRSFSKIDNFLKRRNLKAVKKFYPWGRDFVFDLTRRFAGQDIDIIVDAGANIGSVSLDFAYYFPHSKVLAFEPVFSTYERLKLKTSKYNNIIPVQIALGEGTYQVEISLNAEDTINSISSKPDEQNISGKEVISVSTLDAYIKQNNILKVDLLKIDVEGFEFKVLEGADNLLSNSIKAIVLEVGYERGDSKVHFSDVENYMEQRGFQCCGVYDLSKSRDKKRLYYSNNLYIRKSLL